MSQPTHVSEQHDAAVAERLARTARRMLSAGAVAGPLFVVVAAIQAATRTGFDPSRHPLSLLALGGPGWVQVANFVITGVLYVGFARGLRQVLAAMPGGVWGPRLITVMGLGLVASGVFVTDPGAGFPAGAPDGAPTMSWHGILHEVGYVVVLLSWAAACFVLGRSFAARRERVWAWLTVVAVPAIVVVTAWPDPDSFATRIVVATAVQFGSLTAVALHLRRSA